MKRRAAWLLLAWFAIALNGCETVKGVGRDIMNLGDVLTGRGPRHKTFRSEQPQAAIQGIPGHGQMQSHSQSNR